MSSGCRASSRYRHICASVNAAILRADRLSIVREKLFLSYRINLARDTFVAERTRGKAWLALAPSTLA
jgi:hypothetical protein